MVFNEVNFRHKHPNDMINCNQALYKGFTIKYDIELDGACLYLFSANNSEEFNHICTKR